MKRLGIQVIGRPAPQGSKDYGPEGQLLETSKYLPAWRAKVKEAALWRLLEVGATPAVMRTWPVRRYFVGPVGFSCVFWCDTGQRIDSPPDLDKLVRATWDALSMAKVWEDDGRVVLMREVRKAQAVDRPAGADIWIWSEGEDYG